MLLLFVFFVCLVGWLVGWLLFVVCCLLFVCLLFVCCLFVCLFCLFVLFVCLFVRLVVVVVVVVVVSPWFSMFRSRRRHHILLVAVYPHCLNMRHGTSSYAPTISQSRHLRLVGSSARFFDTFVEQFLIQKAAPI